MKKNILTSIFTLFVTVSIFAQSDACVGTWLTGSKEAQVQIYKQGDKFFGKIVWLKEPIDPETKKPKLDKKNSDDAKKNRPILGMVNLANFKYVSANLWENGTVYDPKNGKEYSCKMTLDGNKLSVRGYVGISLIGRTDVWTRVK